MGTETTLWGQKNNRFKPDDDAPGWRPDAPAVPELVVNEEQISAELNLSDDLTISELKAIRRDFARKNHPDTGTGDASVRESRMKIANMIIDEQIQLRSQT